MNTLGRIVKADPWRHTRWHDMRGNRVSWIGLVDAPQSMLQSALRETIGWRPALPWIPFPAARSLRQRMRPGWRVLEYGSGMSTLWYARHCQFVYSIEHDEEWFRRVGRILQQRGINNVKLILSGEAEYDGQPADKSPFDLVVVDGIRRRECVKSALRLVRRPGCIYLDNTDFGAEWRFYADAEDELLAAAQAEGAGCTHFTGFSPAALIASQGLLVDLPAGS